MNYSFELNNARKDETFATGKINAKSPVVEVFSALANGEEIGKFGAKADKAVAYIKELSGKAAVGDFNAMAELNEIRKFSVQPKLLQEIKLLGLFGSYKPLAWGDTAYLETVTYEGVKANIQASGEDVSTPFIHKKKAPLAPVTISGGHKVNYRELAVGDATTENELQNEVRTAIRNKAALYVVETVFDAIDAATGVRYFYENAGLAKTGVDKLLAKIRRYGKPNIFGDYALLSQFNGFAGYAGTTPTVNGISDAIMDEIHSTGLMAMYNGSVLCELPNGYDYSQVETVDGEKNYKTLLPAGLGIVTPAAPTGGISPVQTFTIGGLTSFTGNSVSDGTIATRFDLAVACGVADTAGIALIHDTNLDSL